MLNLATGGLTSTPKVTSADRAAAITARSLASLDLPATAVGGDALVRQPDVRRQRSGLPEHIDRYSPARGPITTDAQVRWLENRRYAFADCDGAFLVEIGVAPERREIKFQRFGLDEPGSGHIVDNEMGEIRLPSYRAQHCEFRRREPHDVRLITMGIRHPVEHCLIGRCRCRSGSPQIGERR
jgi:hypothetical protein